MTWELVYWICPVLFVLLLFAISAACYYKDKLQKKEIEYGLLSDIYWNAEHLLNGAHKDVEKLRKKLDNSGGKCEDLWGDDCCPDEKKDGLFPPEDSKPIGIKKGAG